MSAIHIPMRMSVLAITAACVAIGMTGCQSVDFYDQTLQEPVPAPMEPPREKSLVSLPSYQIAAPDLLQVEMIKQIPDIREDKVAETRRLIAQGKYETPERLDIAVDRLLGEMLGD